MSLFNRFSVGSKITAASAGILVFLVLIGGIGVAALSMPAVRWRPTGGSASRPTRPGESRP
ncbi:hypothetical protein [Azospirillum ramasamyi]|uniref:hypothetical protein n=1 Tax=Azospirillum ramasamyi TaxID=682998 RepID=UPI001FEA7106|nr:hypothetical protein [Azospirillum ramasamyi]